MLHHDSEHRRAAAHIVGLFQSARDLKILDWRAMDALIDECMERELIIDGQVQKGLFPSHIECLIEAKLLLVSSGWVPTQRPKRAGIGFGVDDFDY